MMLPGKRRKKGSNRDKGGLKYRDRISPMTSADFRYISQNLENFWKSNARSSNFIDSRTLAKIEVLHHVTFYYEFGHMSLVQKNEKDEIEGYIMGFISPSDHNVGVIHTSAVLPSKRKKGIARALYEEFYSICAKQNAERIRVIVHPSFQEMISFHLRLGFKTDSEEAKKISGDLKGYLSLEIELVNQEV